MNEIYRAKLNSEGRLSVPSGCRELAGLHAGQEVLLKVTPDGVLIYTQDQAVKRLQNWVATHVPGGVSLASEVISERRKAGSADD